MVSEGLPKATLGVKGLGSKGLNSVVSVHRMCYAPVRLKKSRMSLRPRMNDVKIRRALFPPKEKR